MYRADGSDAGRFMTLKSLLTLVALSIVGWQTAHAQATPFVPPDDPVYADIDRLSAAGLIDTLIVGARPFSEREILRLLREARDRASRDASASLWATSIIDRDVQRLARTTFRPIDAIGVEETQLDSPYRAAPVDSNGVLPATINPLAAYREGRALAYGETHAIETTHSALLGPYLAVMLNPRFTVESFRSGAGNPAQSKSTLSLQSGAVTLLAGNLSVEAGKDYVEFGQSPTGGLLLSQNAPALEMIRVSNDRPAALPFVSRFLGPFRGMAFVADLGEDEIHPHTALVGYHVAALPSPRLELGFEVIDAMGGNGGQPASFSDRILDAIPIVDVLRANSDFQFSNKMIGVDAHWRVPEWRGFDAYAQVGLDDFDARRLASVLLQDGGYLVGTSLSCLMECGRLGVRFEYHQTGIRFYTHPDYPIEESGMLLGDPLGPRGLGTYLTVDAAPRRGGAFSVTGAFEVRSGDGYASTSTGPHTEGFHFVQAYRRPGEKRARVTGAWTSGHATDRFGVRVTGGVERVANFDFVGGSDRTNFLASGGLVVRP
ncbi:MAG TPA: capsule assembly Wzi family protein [Gemmatimonadaceae bacterium]|jgi:hypothetical protein|nr:capsule assembly Wzi family protein [Gemmatimonadaceae bacterium]